MSDRALSLPQVAALAHAPLIVVDTRAPAPKDVVVEIDETPYVVTFSSAVLFEAWFSPDQPRVVVRGCDMDGALPLGAGFVIDPEQPQYLVVPPIDVARIAAAGRPFPRGHEVKAGEPAVSPDALLADLAAVLEGTGLVRSARWVWHQVRGQAPYAVVVVEADATAIEGITAACWPVLAQHRPEHPVELVLLEDDGEALSWVAANIPPFYG